MGLAFYALVNAAVEDRLSWTTALKKAALGMAVTPVFFFINTTIVEVVRECTFMTIIPKFRQDLGNAYLLALIWTPVQLLNFRLFADPVSQTLFGIVPDIALAVCMNFLYNRGLVGLKVCGPADKTLDGSTQTDEPAVGGPCQGIDSSGLQSALPVTTA
jgi:hypothetical protein